MEKDNGIAKEEIDLKGRTIEQRDAEIKKLEDSFLKRGNRLDECEMKNKGLTEQNIELQEKLDSLSGSLEDKARDYLTTFNKLEAYRTVHKDNQ